MESSIFAVIQQICEEKDISSETVIATVEQALAAAYRKDFGKKNQNIKVEFDPETGQARVFDVKTVVEDLPEETEKEKNGKTKESKKADEAQDEIEQSLAEAEEEERKFNPRIEITLTKAREIKKDAKIDDIIKTELEVPAAYGRMAAQAAKQVIIQKLREAEKESLYKKFKEKEGKVLTGIVQKKEGLRVLVDLEKITAVIPPSEQIKEESYRTGQRIKVYVLVVKQTSKEPEIILSRTHPEIVRQLFFSEVPEVNSGGVEIKVIAREAGSRTKVAVEAKEKNIDPIGSCVGQRGARVQTIISELGGEKIDIIQFDADPVKFISQALSPAKVLSVELEEKGRAARIKVKEDQYSLAIGKRGQNVRLASQLTGWRLEIIQVEKEKDEKIEEPKDKEVQKEKTEEEIIGKNDKVEEPKNKELPKKKTEEEIIEKAEEEKIGEND